jgi:hypothetical protein
MGFTVLREEWHTYDPYLISEVGYNFQTYK